MTDRQENDIFDRMTESEFEDAVLQHLDEQLESIEHFAGSKFSDVSFELVERAIVREGLATLKVRATCTIVIPSQCHDLMSEESSTVDGIVTIDADTREVTFGSILSIESYDLGNDGY